jgi:hypothetical protein
VVALSIAVEVNQWVLYRVVAKVIDNVDKTVAATIGIFSGFVGRFLG